MTRYAAAVCLLLCCLMIGTASAGVVTITLAASPDRVLPGLPVAFIVTIDNKSTTPLTLVNSIRLLGSRDGSQFVATVGNGSDTASLPREQASMCDDMRCVTIDAGGKRQLYLDFGPALTANEFFADPHLSTPGIVQVRLEFLADSAGVATTLDTNPVNLTIQEPAGADLQVWRHMQELTGRAYWITGDWITYGGQLAKWIATTVPVSSYSAWLPAYTPAADPVPAYDAALATNPSGSLRDALLYGKAFALNRQSRDALVAARNEDKALLLADAAHKTLDELQKSTTVDAVRTSAATLAATVLTRKSADEILKTLIQQSPPAPLQVKPRVKCVTAAPGQSFSVTFGYSNPNAAGKTVPFGNDNQVTPAPRDQEQPMYFQPGDVSVAFTASSPGGALKWHLDGTDAVATTDFPVKCAAEGGATLSK